MSAATVNAAAAPQNPPINRTMITISIMLATIIQALDGTIANVALPHMQGPLSASQDQITWVLTSFIVAAAIATPLNGWLVDRFGLKKVFLVSVAGFTVASALCGLSMNLTEIVVSRMLQGVFGAALVPLSQSVLLDINPKEKHGSVVFMCFEADISDCHRREIADIVREVTGQDVRDLNQMRSSGVSLIAEPTPQKELF